jgi:hypothetical protein
MVARSFAGPVFYFTARRIRRGKAANAAVHSISVAEVESRISLTYSFGDNLRLGVRVVLLMLLTHLNKQRTELISK